MGNVEPIVAGEGEVYGFHKTQEGRNFLRYCYGRYLDIQKERHPGPNAPSHGKAALALAESAAKQAAEDKRTAEALRRWLEDGKPEIWQGDLNANLRIAEKLERLVAHEADVAKIMSDRVATVRRLDFATALTTFYNPGLSGYSKALSRQRLSQYTGVFTIWTRFHDHDRLNPNYYRSDTHYRAELHETLPVLSFQEFEIDESKGRTLIKNRRAGFMIVTDEGRQFRFVISHVSPNIRWLEILNPAEIPDDASHLSHFKHRYYVNVYGADGFGEAKAEHIRKSMISGIGNHDNEDLLVHPSSTKIEELVNEHFSGIQWDIVL